LSVFVKLTGAGIGSLRHRTAADEEHFIQKW
jgi:hypothetical protein